MTGKKDSGKSTLGEQLRIIADGVHLDSDKVREIFPCGFSDKERENHIKRMSWLSHIFEEQKKIIIVSAILPRKEWRDMIRNSVERSCTVYLPGGTLWEGTTYEEPNNNEIDFCYNWKENDLLYLWENINRKYKLGFK